MFTLGSLAWMSLQAESTLRRREASVLMKLMLAWELSFLASSVILKAASSLLYKMSLWVISILRKVSYLPTI